MQGRASSWNDKEGLSPGELQYEARGPVQRYIYIYIYIYGSTGGGSQKRKDANEDSDVGHMKNQDENPHQSCGDQKLHLHLQSLVAQQRTAVVISNCMYISPSMSLPCRNANLMTAEA